MAVSSPTSPSPTAMQSLALTDVHALGFDLDHTLIRYRIRNVSILVHQIVVEYLVKQCGYTKQLLQLQYDSHLLSRGLVYDGLRGNFLKVMADNTIVRAMHGTRLMSSAAIEQHYGQPPALIDYDPLASNAALTTIYTYFDLACMMVLAQLIDLADQGCPYESDADNQQFRQQHLNGDNPNQRYTQLLADVHAAIDDQWVDEPNKAYFSTIQRNPSDYVYKRSDLVKWLKQLRQQQPQLTLFVVTNSRYVYCKMLLDYCLGEGWEQLFDVFVADSFKPRYFTDDHPHLSINPTTLAADEPVERLEANHCYELGSVKQLNELFTRLHNTPQPTVLYFGDHLKGDVAVPRKCGWLTGSVMEELEVERPHGVQAYAPAQTADYDVLTQSNIWGDVLTHTSDDDSSAAPLPTVIHQLIVDNCVVCVPCLTYLHDDNAASSKQLFEYAHGQPQCFMIRPTASG